MDKVYINESGKITFQEYLDIHSFINKIMYEKMLDICALIEKTAPSYRVKSVFAKHYPRKASIRLFNIEHNFESNLALELNSRKRIRSFNWDNMEKVPEDEVCRFFNEYLDLLYANKITEEIEDGKFSLRFELCVFKSEFEAEFFKLDKLYGKITILSRNKADKFYYDFSSRQLGLMKESGVVPFPIKVQEKLLQIMNTMTPIDVPKRFAEFLALYGEIIYRNKKTGEFYPHNSFIGSLIGERYYELDLSKHTKKQEEDIEFLDYVKDIKLNIKEESSESIKESIKLILTNLKNSGAQLSYAAMIKIPETLYFREISPEKKIIDPFFYDPDILKNCDLSHIDFTRADIREGYFSNTNARINLSTIYGASIEGASLENINLVGQTLDGILANNANLKGTYITVSLDECSIKNTRFGADATFLLGLSIVDKDTLEKMRINLEEVTTVETMVLK